MFRRALFLDRDGTLVHARHYPSHPDQLHLFDGIGPALRALQDAGFCIVVITNQGGLAHGYFTPAALDQMHAHLQRQLALLHVRIDAIYHCPHDPAGSVPALAIPCACRKPQPGMILHAAADLDLDLARSWLIGDILHDVEAGRRAGCRTVLVDNGGETEWIAGPYRLPHAIAPDTATALRIVAAVENIEVGDEATAGDTETRDSEI